MRWIVLSLLVLISLGAAQQTSTVFDTVLTNGAAVGPTVVVRNIGQNQHIWHFRLSNAPGLVCAAQFTTLYAEGSFDGTNWVRVAGGAGDNIAYIGPDAAGVLQQVLYTVGAFPQLRGNAAAFDTVNCRLTIAYTGSLYPISGDLPAPPWLQRPTGFAPFNIFGAINTPANDGKPYSITTFAITAGNDGVITALAMNYTGGGFVQGSGDLTWRLTQAGAPIGNYSAIISEMGSAQQPVEIPPLRVYSGQTVGCDVTHAVASGLPIAGTKAACRVLGYTYPIKSR